MHTNSTVIKHAATNALITTAYIVLVALFLSNAERIFDQAEPKTILIPILMLLLLVFSAALTGTFVFGRPVMWYLEGKKKEALSLLVYTLGFLFIFTVITILLVYFIS